MTRILMTGARAPASLDLARRLAEGGAEVFAADSQLWPVTGFSRRVRRSLRVRPARWDPDGFVGDLRRLVREHRIDHVVPTCEEVFWAARAPDLPMLLEPRERLRAVHDKMSFIEICEGLGLACPSTRRVSSPEELPGVVEEFGGGDHVVLKPCYSRFATRTLIRPTVEAIARVAPTEAAPWVVQAWVPGPVVCAWAVAHRGRLTVYVDYSARFTAGPGSSVHFAPLGDERVRSWVEQFVAATAWSGHISFDFVLGPDGPVAIECNPRLTSGIHLVSDGAGLLRAWVDPDAPRVGAQPGAQAQIAAGMLVHSLARAWSRRQVREWWLAFRRSREISWDRADVLPFFAQGLSIAALGWTALRAREGLLEASTWDIRWNGED